MKIQALTIPTLLLFATCSTVAFNFLDENQPYKALLTFGLGAFAIGLMMGFFWAIARIYKKVRGRSLIDDDLAKIIKEII